MTTRNADRGAEIDALRLYYAQAGQPDQHVVAALRRHVLTHVDTAPPRTRGRRAARPQLFRRRLVVAVAAASVVAISLAVTLVALSGTDRHTTDQAVSDTLPAPDTLRLVADRSGNAAALVVGEGRYVYTASRVREVAKAPVGEAKEVAWYLTETEIATWASADGLIPARIVITTGIDPRPLTPADDAKLRKSTYPWQRRHTETYQGNGDPGPADPTTGQNLGEAGFANPTPEYLDSLSTDPGQLLAAIRGSLPAGKPDQPGQQDVQQVFLAVATLVAKADALLRPPLRAALYRALALVPGIERVAGQVDLAGRTGISIGRVDSSTRFEIIFDPQTSRLIGTRQVLLKPDAGTTLPAGTVIQWSTTEQKVVPAVGATS